MRHHDREDQHEARRSARRRVSTALAGQTPVRTAESRPSHILVANSENAGLYEALARRNFNA